jgi:hypothetical protein
MPSSQPTPARRGWRTRAICGLRSGGAVEIIIIDTDRHPILKGAERRVRRCLLDGSDRQQKRENENKFGHLVIPRAFPGRPRNAKGWLKNYKDLFRSGMVRCFQCDLPTMPDGRCGSHHHCWFSAMLLRRSPAVNEVIWVRQRSMLPPSPIYSLADQNTSFRSSD